MALLMLRVLAKILRHSRSTHAFPRFIRFVKTGLDGLTLDNGRLLSHIENPMKVWLTAVLTLTLFIGAGRQVLTQPTERPWEEPASLCGVSFQIMRGDWRILHSSPEPGSQTCAGSLRSRLYDKIVAEGAPDHFWNIRIDVHPKRLEDLMEELEIRREGDRWFVGEGARQQPAYQIIGPGWWGLKVDHYSFRTSIMLSAGERVSAETEGVWVVISSTTSTRTAELLAGQGSDDGPLQLLLNTFKFDKNP